MDVFSSTSYKDALKDRVKELSTGHRRYTLRKLADKIPVQYTYLSRVLNRPEVHLSEDHLFRAGKLLEFFPEEIEFLFLLRGSEVTSDVDRKKHLSARIDRTREEKKLNASVQEFKTLQIYREMSYLLDPLGIVVLVSLDVSAIRENPQKLCGLLGITQTRLREILRNLCELEMIELAGDGITVVRLLKRHIHYGADHPLMRVHQNVLRSLSSQHVMKLEEKDKQNFMVTFSADDSTVEKIRGAFQAFLQQIEKIVVQSKSDHSYQLNFDLFKWV